MYGVTKPYVVPKTTKQLNKERFIFNEHFSPNLKVMV